jgi:predicted nucleic acid-binding protein
MPLIVDCSVAAAWALADERSQWTDAALQAATLEGALAPSLFWFEIRNILVVNERRGRVNSSQSDQFLADLSALLKFDITPVESAVMSLARVHKITVYDASYLELAQRLGLPLVTLDRELIAASPKIGLQLWRP